MPMLPLEQGLHYHIHLENGFFLQSVGTGEGAVNTFRGTGEIYVQSLNLETFAKNFVWIYSYKRVGLTIPGPFGCGLVRGIFCGLKTLGEKSDNYYKTYRKIG